jgi:hypothetical protein
MPVRDGRVCAYTNSYTHEELNTSVANTVTQEYTDVREEADGTHFTLETTTQTTTTGDAPDSSETFIYSEPITQNPSYVLGDDGLLRTEPGLVNEGILSASYDEFIVYPSIKEIREGKSASSSITASVRSSDPATQAELEEGLEPGESEMKMRVDYTVEGIPPKEITTPAGTFTDVVGVSLRFDDIEVLNANEEMRRQMDEMAKLLAELTGTTTGWYARDTGIVQVETEGGIAEAMMGEATSAGGETAPAIPPLKLERCDDLKSRFPETWSGHVTMTDSPYAPGSVVEYVSEINAIPIDGMTQDLVGEEVGDIRYSSGCAGVLILEEVNEDSVAVEQQMKEEKGVSKCDESSPATLSLQEDGTLKYLVDWNPYVTYSGTFTREGSG